MSKYLFSQLIRRMNAPQTSLKNFVPQITPAKISAIFTLILRGVTQNMLSRYSPGDAEGDAKFEPVNQSIHKHSQHPYV